MDFDPRYVTGEAQTDDEDSDPGIEVASAKSPEYARRSQRRKTYRTWPQRGVDVQEMIDSGMFYKGEDDKTECFYCGIPLKQWEKHDVPWIEHARFSHNCQFLRHKKGLAFIIAVLEFYDLPAVNELKQRSRVENAAIGRSETGGASSYVPESTASHSQQATRPRQSFRRRVEPREIRSRLDLSDAKTLVDLGYPRELVGQVIGEQLQTEADDFANFGELARAVMNAAELLGIPLHTERAQPMSSQSFPPRAPTPRSMTETQGSSAASSSPVPFASLPVGTGSAAATTTEQEGSIKEAMEENKNLKEKLYCKRCWKKEVNVVLLNCGHMVLCEDCAKLVHICPKCHNHILQRVKVFVA